MPVRLLERGSWARRVISERRQRARVRELERSMVDALRAGEISTYVELRRRIEAEWPIFDRVVRDRGGSVEAAAATAVDIAGAGDRVRRSMVVAEVRRVAEMLVPGLSDLLVAAAWLMDIGAAARVADTGFEALDGAVFIRREGFPSIVAELVAHHTATDVEAAARGLAHRLAEFPAPPAQWSAILTYANLRVGEHGEIRSAAAGIAEIVAGARPGGPAQRAVRAAAASLAKTAASVEDLLRQHADQRSVPVPPAADTERFIRAAAEHLGWRVITDDGFGRWTAVSGDHELSMLWLRPPMVDLHEMNAPHYAKLWLPDGGSTDALRLYPTGARQSREKADSAEELVRALLCNLVIYAASQRMHGPAPLSNIECIGAR